MSNKVKVAINAGHCKYTPGRRCLKAFDPNETQEWVLNARVAEHLEDILTTKYDSFELLRIDDPTGETGIPNDDRISKANKWKADIWIGIHHNAGINGGKGGGVTVYRYLKVDNFTKELQKAIYDGIIKHNGLVGNRAEPLKAADLIECRETAMPAVLIENGFMDSSVDVPQIITDEFSYKTALGIAEGIAKVYNVQPKSNNETEDYKARIQELEDKISAAQELIEQASDALD